MGKVPAALGTAATAAAIATLALPLPAHAQGDDAPPPEASVARGFSERGSVLLSVENAFGILAQTNTQGSGPGAGSTSLQDNGFFPQGYVGTKLGVNGLLPYGITLGGIVGVWNDTSTNQNGGSYTVFNIGPRIGWAGCSKKYKALGFWWRVGPTFQYLTSSPGGNGSSGGSDAWALALSFDAFLVWSPVDHFGLLAGPTFDVGLTGNQSQNNVSSDFGYHSVGASLGLVFEL